MSAILVDAFGTIVETRPPWLEMREVCFREAIAGSGAEFLRFMEVYGEERLLDHQRAPGDWREFDFPDRFRRAFARVGVQDPEGWGARAAARYHDFQGRLVAPLADAREGLEELARLGPLILLSNYPNGPALLAALRRLGLAGFFQDHVVSGDIGWLKPHPEPFLAGARKAGVKPQETVMVGNDAHDDLGGARAVGAACVLVAYPRGTGHPVPEGALGVAGDLPEAATMIRAHRRR